MMIDVSTEWLGFHKTEVSLQFGRCREEMEASLQKTEKMSSWLKRL